MKRDTSNIIDIDKMFEAEKKQVVESQLAKPAQQVSVDLDQIFNQQVISKVQKAPDTTGIDYNEILTEWSYQCPKGYPTIVDGQFTDPQELEILQEILEKRDLSFPGMTTEVVTSNTLSTNPTDVKEAMVCLFADAGLSDQAIFDKYRQTLNKSLDPNIRKKLTKEIKASLSSVVRSFGKNYGISGYASMPEFVAQITTDPKTYKADSIVVNNGVGAAEAIVNNFGMLKPGMVRREKFFNEVRAHAVYLINDNYKIKGYYPDNWCPGDIYFVLNDKANNALKTKRLNVGAGSLNDYFYGTSNKKGPILAVSLKMQTAQAGKGTTFIKNVVIDNVTPADKESKDKGGQQLIKLRDMSRRFGKYYFDSDEWKTDPSIFEKLRALTSQLSKMAGIPNVPVKKTETKALQTYLAKNKNLLKKAIDNLQSKLGKSVDTATVFQQAYTRFVNNLKAMNIQKVEGDSKNFIKSVEAKNKKDNGGKLDVAKIQTLLSQKAATYDLASILIEKWTEKTKKVSPAFAEHLVKVKNPFIAITMFAIAQHGLNPNFYKAIGTNNATPGSISEFPSNSVVDEKKSIQKLKVIDSPGQAGFYIEYLLNINNHTYKTTLVFRFSRDQIRVEVEELAQV